MSSPNTSPAWLAAGFLALALTFSAAGAVVFNDSAPETIAIENAHYRVRFSKANGGIVSVTDLATGLDVSRGSRNGCLWGASTPPDVYTGGCGAGRAFAYQWDAAAARLSMTWGSGDSGLAARVIVTPAEGSWLDMRLELSGSFDRRYDYVLFPSDVLFDEANVRQVLLPILPGVVLQPGFFAENRTYLAKYPGEGMFSDLFALDSEAGQLSIYVLGEGRVHPAILGVAHDSSSPGDLGYYSHSFAVRLRPGETWVSPTVRWRVGQSFVEVARAFRRDSGIEELPSLEERLGPLYSRIVKAPFLKIDMEVMRRPFAEYERLLRELPVPSVLHWVGYGTRGFDEDYPDFLPPHPAHGSTAQFAALFRKARAMGHFNMPYTNPTWWDDESPTMGTLPSGLTIRDIAVIDDDGGARYETFGPKGGYAVSPWHPFVRQRADASVEQMTKDVPSDLLFQDQIGARPWIFDSNPSSPSPTAFIEGWIEYTGRHRGVLLGTEQGFDALIPTEVAFFGSVPGEDDEWSDARFGPGNWAPWPFVPIVAGDRVLLYPHNMGANPPVDSTFRMNVAFGQMMMYTLHNPEASIFDFGPGGGLDTDAFRTVTALQRTVIARALGESIEAFEMLAPGVTRTRFTSMDVVVNGSEAAYEHAGEVIPAGGFLVRTDDGTLTAGVFDRYGGVPLSPGRHLIVEERSDEGISVWKTEGPASSLVVRPLEELGEGAPVEVRAVDVGGRLVRTVPWSMTPYGVLFQYATAIDDHLVDHYEIVDPTRPVRRRGVRP